MTSSYEETSTNPTVGHQSTNPVSNTVHALNPNEGTGSHLPTSTHNQTGGYSNESSLTGEHPHSGLSGHHSHGNQTGGFTGSNDSALTGNTTYSKEHRGDDQYNSKKLSSTGLPGSAHNNDSPRRGHGLDTEQITGHHSRRDPNHDSSIAGSAGARELSLEESRAHAAGPGPTYPDVGSNPAHGTGAGPSHGTPGVYGGPDTHHTGATDGTTHKVSMGDKVKGTVDVLIGKATHSPAKVAEGQALKTGTAVGSSNTALPGNHHDQTGAGAHGLSSTHAGQHHSTTDDTFPDKDQGFAKEHVGSTGHSGNTLAGSGTGL